MLTGGSAPVYLAKLRSRLGCRLEAGALAHRERQTFLPCRASVAALRMTVRDPPIAGACQNTSRGARLLSRQADHTAIAISSV